MFKILKIIETKKIGKKELGEEVVHKIEKVIREILEKTKILISKGGV